MSSTSHRAELLAYLALGGGILMLSTSAIFVRWADAPGPITGFYRMTFAALLLIPIVAWRNRGSPLPAPRALIFPLVAGIFSGFDLSVWTLSLSYTTAANATLLGNTAPLWVALVSWLVFRRHLKGVFWLGLALALSGAALVMGTDFLIHPSMGLGDILAIITGMFYAGYYLTTELGRRHLAPLIYTLGVALSAAVTMLVVNIAMGNPLVGYSPTTWLMFLSTALVSQIGGYFCLAYALGHLPASVVSTTMIGQPVVTTLIAIPLLGEVPRPLQAVGGLIALAGIYLVNQAHGRTKTADPADTGPT